MKITSTIIKVSLTALFSFVSSVAMSATYYVCTGATIALGANNLPAGTTALWDLRQSGSSLSGYPSATAPTTFATAGVYEVILVSVTGAATGACASDPVSHTVNVLPALSLTLGTPNNDAYCEGTGTATSSEMTPSGVTIPTDYAADLGFTYTYSVTSGANTYNGTDDLNGSPLGSIDPLTGKYTLSTKVPGTYVITGSVKYVQLSGATGTLLGDGCPATASGTIRTVTVTPKPAQPTITISAN